MPFVVETDVKSSGSGYGRPEQLFQPCLNRDQRKGIEKGLLSSLRAISASDVGDHVLKTISVLC